MKVYLDMKEIEQLENAATNLKDKLLIRVLTRLGCRISEALAIEVKHVDFAQGTATIQHLKARLKLNCSECGARLAKSDTYCPKCSKEINKPATTEHEHRRMRTLPIDDNTLELLRDFIKQGGPVNQNDKPLIFGINRHRAWQIVRSCAEKAGLPPLINPESGRIRGVSSHRLRDALAVHAMKHDDSGDGLRLLQEFLGHASFNTHSKIPKGCWSKIKAVA